MKRFDPSYSLLEEMYQDDYYPKTAIIQNQYGTSIKHRI